MATNSMQLTKRVEPITAEMLAIHELRREAREWCYANIKRGSWLNCNGNQPSSWMACQYVVDHFAFEYKEDAVTFKLMFPDLMNQ